LILEFLSLEASILASLAYCSSIFLKHLHQLMLA